MTRLVFLAVVFIAAILTACAGPGPAGPAAPTEVAATDANGVITVTWTHDGADTSGFRISREAAGSAAVDSQVRVQAEIGEVGADERTFVDRSAEVGVPYNYSVVAFGPDGASDPVSPSTPVAASSGFAIRVGTYDIPLFEDPDLAIGVFLHLAPSDLNGAADSTLTLTGPEGWNGGAPAVLTISATAVERGHGWYAAGKAVVGDYTAELDTGVAVFTSSATLDSLATVPYPTGVAVTEFDATSVTATWDAHPQAESYSVTVFSGTYQAPTFVKTQHTTATTDTFSGLALEPGSYFVGVYVMPIDRTDTQRLVPPERFDVSLDASGIFEIP